jgi:saccharopine dehydrogenase-like NADP-dependent oxidoreductase
MEHVVVVIGAGQIGQATARVGGGKHVVLADRSEANATWPSRSWSMRATR